MERGEIKEADIKMHNFAPAGDLHFAGVVQSCARIGL
jgi:hypothetical protein